MARTRVSILAILAIILMLLVLLAWGEARSAAPLDHLPIVTATGTLPASSESPLPTATPPSQSWLPLVSHILP